MDEKVADEFIGFGARHGPMDGQGSKVLSVEFSMASSSKADS